WPCPASSRGATSASATVRATLDVADVSGGKYKFSSSIRTAALYRHPLLAHSPIDTDVPGLRLPSFHFASPSGKIRTPIPGGIMNRSAVIAVLIFASFSLAPLGSHVTADDQPLYGYSAESSRTERQWEEKLRAIPSPDNLRNYMQRLSAHPHHVGSPYDKDNAEWIASKFKEFGLDTHIEQFDVLFPTPKERAVELVDGGPQFTA